MRGVFYFFGGGELFAAEFFPSGYFSPDGLHRPAHHVINLYQSDSQKINR